MTINGRRNFTNNGRRYYVQNNPKYGRKRETDNYYLTEVDESGTMKFCTRTSAGRFRSSRRSKKLSGTSATVT